MFTLLGSLLGFTTSFLPQLVTLFRERSDRKHEIAMISAQADAQLQLQTGRVEEAHVSADIREIESLHDHDRTAIKRASHWAVNLSASVRPVITYLFFIEWVVLTICITFDWISFADYSAIWNDPMQAIFAAVVSFWFGSRSFNRKSHT